MNERALFATRRLTLLTRVVARLPAPGLAPITGHKEEPAPEHYPSLRRPVLLSGPRQPARRRAPYAPSTRRRTSSILLIDSDLQTGSELSSSASVELGVALALSGQTALRLTTGRLMDGTLLSAWTWASPRVPGDARSRRATRARLRPTAATATLG